MRVSLAGPFHTSRSVVAAAQQTMNLIPETVEVPNEPTRMALYGRPGLKYFSTAPAGSIRGMWAGGGRLFTIDGPNETEYNQNGTVKQIWSSTLAVNPSSDTDYAQIFSNGNQLMIVAGGLVYCDNGTGAQPARFTVTGTGNTSNTNNGLYWVSGPTFNSSWTGMPITINGVLYTVGLVTPPNFLVVTTSMPTATNVVWSIGSGAQVDGVTGGFQDGYFFVNRVPGGSPDLGRQFNMSALMDGTQWDPLAFGTKEGGPDYIRSILCDHEELWLFGTETIEVWQDVGSQVVNGLSTFPYQRIAGAFIHDGSAATWAPTSIAGSVCYLGAAASGQTVAFQATGLQPQRISTHAEESAWNTAGYRVNDVFAYGYSEDGHAYWVLNFWQQQDTFVYDLNEGLWHKRAGWNASTQQFQRYQPWFHVFIPEWSQDNTGVQNGVHIVGERATGKLYAQKLDYTTDNGLPIEYLRAFPHLINEDQYGYHHRFELLMETGAMQSTDTSPLVGLDWSDDHGHTWKDTISRTALPFTSGNYTQRVAFRRLGKARDRIYRVGVQATTKVALIDAYVEMTQGFA